MTSWSAGKFKLLINYVTYLISEPPSVHFIALIPLVTMQMQIELNNWLSVDGETQRVISYFLVIFSLQHLFLTSTTRLPKLMQTCINW